MDRPSTYVVCPLSQCTCTTDKEATCIVHPTVRSLKEYIEASQNLLRASNKRIDQLENEKSLMAKYMGRLEATIAELRDAASWSRDLLWRMQSGQVLDYNKAEIAQVIKAIDATLEQRVKNNALE